MVGDVNGDGRVNNRDLGNLQQYLNGWIAAVDGDADLNSDSKVNNQDLGLLQQAVNENAPVPLYAANAKYVELGAPAAVYYPRDYIARVVWDMDIYDGRLYIGNGNFGTNSGPAPVLSCSLDDLGNWVEEAIVPDEQIIRFVNINGKFLIPGCDPAVGMGTASGNGFYYELVDGRWVTRDHLPNSLHNFDLAWFEGRVYAAIGSGRGGYPVAYTEDGIHYEQLPFYKDGQLRPTDQSNVIRTCNLYVLEGELYADFWYESEESYRTIFEMYHYNKETDYFEYVADLKSVTHGGLYGVAGLPLWEKAVLGQRMFLTTGYLYFTTDFMEYTQVEMPNAAVVYDMVTYEDGRLYLLTSYPQGDAYRIAVYSLSETNPTALRTEVTFDYKQMPTSFAMDEDNFYIGTGNWYDNGSADNGMILQVQR